MRAHYKFYPKRLPHALTLPVTSLVDNLPPNPPHHRNQPDFVISVTVLPHTQLPRCLLLSEQF